MSVPVEAVAKRSGVSVSTVSRALRDVPGISEETRKRVRRVAEELGYVPSLQASRLATGKTGTIAVVTPNLSKWFFGQVVGSAGEVFREAGYDVLLFELPNTMVRDRFFTGQGLRGRADGVLFLAMQPKPEEIGVLEKQGLPVAFLGSRQPGRTGILVDDREGGRAAVRHLLNLGHERIAFIGIRTPPGSTLGGVPPGQRLLGYRDALAEAGLQAVEGFEQFEENSTAGGSAAISRLLCAPLSPTAVFVASDEMAFGALSTLRKAGMQVPTDMSVIGYDNHELSEILDLTTMDHSVREQGTGAAKLLLSSMRGIFDADSSRDNASLTMPARIIVRTSTAPPQPLRNRPPATPHQ